MIFPFRSAWRHITRLIISSLRSPIDRSGQTTRLPLEVELHVHIEQMLERLSCDLPDSPLRNRCKDCISQLSKHRRQDSGCSVYSLSTFILDDRASRQLTSRYTSTGEDPNGRALRNWHIQSVHNLLEEERHLDIEHLASYQKCQRSDHSELDSR